MKPLLIRKLIVDERNELFDAQGMRYLEFPNDFFSHPRIYRDGTRGLPGNLSRRDPPGAATCGMIYNEAHNKVGVVRWFTRGSSK